MGTEALLHKIKRMAIQQQEDIAAHLAAGGADNIEDYNRMVGRYEGIKYFYDIMIDAAKELADAEDSV